VTPPPITVQTVSADDKTYDLIRPLKFLAHTSSVQISYNAVSLSNPDATRFRYKLQETDSDWLEVSTASPVTYRNLPPGSYHFNVTASDTNGDWSDKVATAEFAILPAFYQTRWFLVLCIAAALGALYLVYLLRLRQVTARVRQRLEGRFEERERIARELHDTLLQSFQGHVLFLQSGLNLLPDRPDVAGARERLQGAIDQAVQAITEGRDAVQGLRSSTIQTNDLAAALNTLAVELAASQGGQNTPVFDILVEGESRDLHPILRGDIFRIAGEALRNAFLHAQASRIEVQIRYDERQLRVRIRDDGIGIDPQIVTNKGRPGHWGLRGMQERARLVGGNLEVWSKPDSGTAIYLTIPASTAYATSTQRRSWLYRRRAAKTDDSLMP